jgi:hypothetical protein
MTAIVRTLVGAQDDEAVRRIFRATLALGRPLDVVPLCMRAYERLCLGWYLEGGRPSARVLVDGTDVIGYALVCTDERNYEHWLRRRALAVGFRAVPAAVISGFWRHRLRDAVVLHALPKPAVVHAHLNLVREARSGSGALALCQEIDEICRESGHDAWYGEVNARLGRRASALERVVGEVVFRSPNHTLTWMTGSPIERLTVVRRLQAMAA